MSIERVFSDFLEEQEKKLAYSTYLKYENAVERFILYLDGYAYNYMDQKELSEIGWDISGEISFCSLVSIDEICESFIDEYLGYFLIKKCLAGKNEILNAITMFNKLLPWLYASHHISEENKNNLLLVVKKLKPKLLGCLKLADLLDDVAQENTMTFYDRYHEGVFEISRIEQGKLWFSDYMEDEEFGPINVSDEISSTARLRWSFWVEFGFRDGSWHIAYAGTVLP